jgi:hypothetical protein
MEERLAHRIEEIGQARPLTAGEVLAYALRAWLHALGWGLAAGAVVAGYQTAVGEPVRLGHVGLATAAVGLVALGVALSTGMNELHHGLRHWRTVESYHPPQAQPAPPKPEAHPPIIVRAMGQEPTVLDAPERPALPDGRHNALEPTPEVLSVILREVIERHDGRWSRDRLMGIRVDGKRVTRRLYEELTSTLARAGVLRQRPTGGFRLPEDVHEYEDLAQYFGGLPGLPAGQAGGTAGRPERAPELALPASDGEGEPLTIAERRRQEWLATRREDGGLSQTRGRGLV